MGVSDETGVLAGLWKRGTECPLRFHDEANMRAIKSNLAWVWCSGGSRERTGLPSISSDDIAR
jgi:hypothetical protein